MRFLALILCVTAISAPMHAQDLVDGFDNCGQWAGKLKRTIGPITLWNTQGSGFQCDHSEGLFNSGFDVNDPTSYQEAFNYRAYSFKAGHKYLVIAHASIVESNSGVLKVYASNEFLNGFNDLHEIVSTLIPPNFQQGGHTSRGIFIPDIDYSNVVLSFTTSGYYSSGFYQPDGFVHDITIFEDPCSGTNASIGGLINNTYLCGSASISGISDGGSSMGFLWSTGATTYTINPPTSGTYSVYVSDLANCIQFATANIEKVSFPPVPVVTPSGSVGVCTGQTTTATSTEASSYLWSNGATTRSVTVGTAGAYSVRVYNQFGCSTLSNSSMTLTVNAYPDKPTISGSHFICPGNSTVQLTAQNVLPPNNYQYSWSPGGQTSYQITTGTLANHVVTATRNGCSTASDPFSVAAGTSQGTINQSGTLCDGFVVLTAGNGSGYAWSSGHQSASATVYFEGTYFVSYYNSQGCNVFAEAYVGPYEDPGGCPICPRVNAAESSEPQHSYKFGVYPNPANESFLAVLSSTAESDCPLRLYDVTGRLRKADIIDRKSVV